MFELGYLLHYHNPDKFGDFYSDFELTSVLGILNKNKIMKLIKLMTKR